jgi:hypothetical protein
LAAARCCSQYLTDIGWNISCRCFDFWTKSVLFRIHYPIQLIVSFWYWTDSICMNRCHNQADFQFLKQTFHSKNTSRVWWIDLIQTQSKMRLCTTQNCIAQLWKVKTISMRIENLYLIEQFTRLATSFAGKKGRKQFECMKFN